MRWNRAWGAAFPPLYRALLKYLHFYELGGSVRWQEHVVSRWQNDLIDCYGWIPGEILGTGMIPFASKALMDAGAVCFDTRVRLPDRDCAVVFWDHEWFGRSKEIHQMFSSFKNMLRCLEFEARADIGFMHHDVDRDDPALLPRRRKLIAEFLSLDPQGAGAAREYWTSWGVDPDELAVT
jgi:hypothetical protein